MIGNSIGVQFRNYIASGVPIDAQAQAHFNRVIADGGVVPSGLTGVNAFFSAVKAIYGTSDINTAISAAYDPHYLGYRLGAGSGTTLGQAARTLYSCSGASADVTQTTAASQPLLLAHTGENYWQGVGVNGNFVSTPNAVANQITGDIDLIAFINMTTTSYRNILTKDDAASNRQFIFSINNTLQLGLNFGAGIVTYNSTINIPSGANVWIRATRNATNGEIRFFTSNDASTTNPQSVTWTQLGTTVSGSTGSTINGNSVLCVGAQSASGVNAVLGRIFRATIANSIGGTPVVDFNPSSYNPSTSQTQWTSATGEVWTINTGTATTGYKGQVVTKTTTQSDGIDDRMQAASYALTATGVSVYSTYRKFTSTSASAFSVIVETSANHNTNQGFIVDFNDGVNTSFNAIRGNVGTTNASFLDTSILLKLVTSVFDLSLATEEASFYAVNNSALTKAGGINSNNTTMTTSGLNLMARNNTTTGLANMIFDGLIISNIADNSTQRTAMYNYLRSLNNNAF